jgi:hypothetical protein
MAPAPTVPASSAPSASIADVADLIDEAEVAVRQAVPAARLIFLEPDLRKTTTST